MKKILLFGFVCLFVMQASLLVALWGNHAAHPPLVPMAHLQREQHDARTLYQHT